MKKEKILRINPDDPEWMIPENPLRIEPVYDEEGEYVWSAYYVADQD